MFVVDSVGRSGGLILLWNEAIGVAIQNYSRRHINALITVGRDGVAWKFSSFYEHQDVAKRRESWALLRHLSTLALTPWLCVGDFNEIPNLSKKWGAATRARRHMVDFQEALEDCQLCDLGFKGPKFTWNNGRDGAAFMKERLDRVVANSEWRSMFDAMDVTILASRSSDHHPLYIALNHEVGPERRKKKQFRFEASWCEREDYKELVRKTWK